MLRTGARRGLEPRLAKGFKDQGLGFGVQGVCLHRAAYPCADGATPLPGICGWRHILHTANFVDVAQEAIETGLSSTFPPAVRHDRLPFKLLPVRVGPPGASEGLRVPGALKWGCTPGIFEPFGVQRPAPQSPPGPSETLQDLHSLQASSPGAWPSGTSTIRGPSEARRVQRHLEPVLGASSLKPSLADLLQLGALGPWVWGITIKGKINVQGKYLAGSRAVPPDVREEPALYVHSS